MGQDISRAGKIALVMLGEVPAIGPSFRRKEEARWNAQGLLKKIDHFLQEAHLHPYRVMFQRQADGCSTLVIKSGTAAVEILANMDELLLKRFQKVFRNLFILTCFYEGDGKLECLAVTEGLGAVLYSACDFSFFQTR
ncbi:MAG: hypothetical protein K6U04_00040 [Armatimonadetes bacterium]|nr:hypothetical protein [Armatimonadota bacterium]